MSNKLLEKIELQKALEKEIDLIQACINRMSQHSFYLKGWLVTLVGIVLALKPKNFILVDICIIFISIVLWYLNATYLRYEKQYRKLYEWVIKERLECNNSNFLYDLNIKRFDKDVEKRYKLMFKNTLFYFYGTITLILIVLLIIFFFKTYNISINISPR